ncbi:MAG: cupin domain-containing protein [Myxococcaceae bacterium]
MRNKLAWTASLAWLALAPAAWGDGGSPASVSPADSGALVPDAGASPGDAGLPDAGPPPADAGGPTPDAGASPSDAGLPVPDAGPADAGRPAPDAGVPVPDAGPPVPPWTRPFVFHTEQAPVFRREGVESETRVLIDGPRVGADKASMVLVTASGNIEVWPHRHPGGAELVYLLEGSARVRGANLRWVDLKAGDAVYLPTQVAHGWWWLGSKEKPARLLFLYTPTGPERAFSPAGGPDGSVLLTAAELKKPSPRSPQPSVVKSAAASSYIIAQRKGLVRMYFEQQNAPDTRGYLGILRADPGMVVPEHAHETEAEFLYIISGRGQLTLDGRSVGVGPGMAIHLPTRHRHSLKVTQTLEAVQFYTPNGPEQRFKPAPK